MFVSTITIYVKGVARSNIEILTNNNFNKLDTDSKNRAKDIFETGYKFEGLDKEGIPTRSFYPPNAIHRVDWRITEED